jgi:hypothetical protein
VLERTYPTHWISPNLYSAGATITIPLQGYEAAIYEVYPLKDAKRPLLAGAEFEVTKSDEHQYSFHLLDNSNEVKFLNPSMIRDVKINNHTINVDHLNIGSNKPEEGLKKVQNTFDNYEIETKVNLNEGIVSARYIVFLKPDSSFNGKDFPAFVLSVDGKKVEPTIQQQKGSWATYSYQVTGAGNHNFELKLNSTDKVKDWKGEATVWLSSQQQQKGKEVDISTDETIKIPPMPPSPYADGALMQNTYVGEGKLNL